MNQPSMYKECQINIDVDTCSAEHFQKAVKQVFTKQSSAEEARSMDVILGISIVVAFPAIFLILDEKTFYYTVSVPSSLLGCEIIRSAIISCNEKRMACRDMLMDLLRSKSCFDRIGLRNALGLKDYGTVEAVEMDMMFREEDD